MATLTPTPGGYVAGIYRIETTDEALGGESGTANIQAKQLANRTDYLKGIVDTLEGQTLDTRLDAVETTTSGFDARLDALEPVAYSGLGDTSASNYSLQLTDSGKVIRINGGGTTVTVPSAVLNSGQDRIYRLWSQFAFTLQKAATAGAINWNIFDAAGNDITTSNNTVESLAIAKNKMVTIYGEGNTFIIHY